MPTFRDDKEITKILNDQDRAFLSVIEAIEEEMDESLRESCSACHTQLQDQLTSYSNLDRSEINAQKLDIERAFSVSKLLTKYLKYIERSEDDEEKSSFTASLREFTDKIKKGDYLGAITAYHVTFSEQDWKKANTYFEEHQDATFAGSQEDLMYSYIKTGDIILRRSNELGSGMFGRTKLGNESEGEPTHAIKRQTRNPTIDESEWLPNIQREAATNFDLGVALSPLITRAGYDGKVYKVYQDMRNLGQSLTNILRNAPPTQEQQIDLGIQLLTKVMCLHQGVTSKTGTRYAHRDIKPANVMIDNDGELHLIDFGLTKSAKDENLNTVHRANAGSPEFMPISFENNTSGFDPNNVVRTPSYYFDDKIATIRTLFHPGSVTQTIFSEDTFNALPKPIREALDTHNIQACIQNDAQHTLTFLTAALIFYKNNPTCSEKDIQDLMKNPAAQIKLIQEHTQLETISLLRKEVNALPQRISYMQRGIVAVSSSASAFYACIQGLSMATSNYASTRLKARISTMRTEQDLSKPENNSTNAPTPASPGKKV